MIVWLLVFLIIAPEFVLYWKDVVLVLIFIFYVKDFKLILLVILYFLFLLTKYLISFDNQIILYLAPMARPILYAGIIFNIIETHNHSSEIILNKIKNSLIFLFIFLASVSIVGIVDPITYGVVNDFWNLARQENLLLEGRRSVAVLAAAQGRISSIFGQPATAGLAFYCIIISFIMLKDKFNKYLLFLLLISALYIGLLPKSSFFSIGLILTIFVYIILKYVKIKLNLPLLLMPTFLFLLIISFSINELNLLGDDIMSGRLTKNSHSLVPLKNMSSLDLFFGINSLANIRIGDSAITLRIVLGGIIFHFIYIILLYKIFSYKLQVIKRNDRIIIISFLITLSFGELGFTSFSQPSISALLFFPILIAYFKSKVTFK
jgi:hypothetical protein